ncbi:Mitochondrial inner membrane protease subunit 2 [Sphaceloma murrayae]|uniref:Mitochondrial inner membrane protease subunit n=1 Tax=Sphaceloma murrayae TaxID=2082308 RepID=A0A2K1R1B0_9PEZI|nr:Mitochondrial inner membrane protease subunit 2 [Sphaceloma murrayae]
MFSLPNLSRYRPYLPLLTYPLWTTGIVILLNDHFAELLSVNGRSMAPTLSPNYHETGQKDYLLMRKHGVTYELQRGDVVSFWSPHKIERLVVKRVVALEGDLVWLDRRRFERAREIEGTSDGEVEEMVRAGLQKDIQWGEDEGMHMQLSGAPKGAVRIPPGHVWVEGDNWRESGDSNYYGPIKVRDEAMGVAEEG